MSKSSTNQPKAVPKNIPTKTESSVKGQVPRMRNPPPPPVKKS